MSQRERMINEGMINEALDSLRVTISSAAHPAELLDTIEAATKRMVNENELSTAREFLYRISQRIFMPMSESFKQEGDQQQAWAYAQVGRHIESYAESMRF